MDGHVIFLPINYGTTGMSDLGNVYRPLSQEHSDRRCQTIRGWQLGRYVRCPISGAEGILWCGLGKVPSRMHCSIECIVELLGRWNCN